MFTHRYRGCWIHGRCDRDECRVQLPDYAALGTFKSYRAAQLAIAAWIRRNAAA